MLLTSLICWFSLDGVEVILKSFRALFRRTCLKKLVIACPCQVQSLESSVEEAMPCNRPQEHLESKVTKVNETAYDAYSLHN